MEISQRLQRIAEHVPKDAILADIGTDHGLLPIWLIRNQRIRKAFACDVRRGPLSRAEEHIQKAGLQRSIETRLSDGFAALRNERVTTAVIAGMGGRLTARILQEDIAGEPSVLRGLTDLLLQPQSEWDIVRRVLQECGFRIIDEEMLFEKGQYYLIIHSQPGVEPYAPEEYRWGRWLIAKRDPVFRAYLEEENRKNQNLQTVLQQEEPTEALRQRLQEVQKEERHIREVLALWQ